MHICSSCQYCHKPFNRRKQPLKPKKDQWQENE